MPLPRPPSRPERALNPAQPGRPRATEAFPDNLKRRRIVRLRIFA